MQGAAGGRPGGRTGWGGGARPAPSPSERLHAPPLGLAEVIETVWTRGPGAAVENQTAEKCRLCRFTSGLACAPWPGSGRSLGSCARSGNAVPLGGQAAEGSGSAAGARGGSGRPPFPEVTEFIKSSQAFLLRGFRLLLWLLHSF